MKGSHFIKCEYVITILALAAVFLGVDLAHGQTSQSQNESVMLLLGSANPEVTRHRVEVAADLYYSEVSFARIVVSGGCGAYKSSICEASSMDSLLVQQGIPPEKIFEEEKSNSTKQNLCYSQKLSYEGEPVIGKGDNLYVVSDHWHAISVAGCFSKYGRVNKSVFHIEGSIEPRGPVDYTDIFKDCAKTNYCKSILWAFVDAAYFDPVKNKIYYFVDNIYYRKTPGKGIDAGFPKKLSQYPGWPKDWSHNVDAAYSHPGKDKVFLFNGVEFVSHAIGEAIEENATQKIAGAFKFWPRDWGRGYLDAAYYNGERKEIYLFKGSQYDVIRTTGLAGNKPKSIKQEYSKAWPFQWGTGDIDAVYYRSGDSGTILFRGTDFLQRSSQGGIDSKYPQAISLPWPEAIWGARP
ncbi:MAG TPA: ElyC/SanA/YdcF family protein [Fodinibius sp.]|nr:ElyC/SanA/YdcF family protein [Fodinibius sp.]